MFVCGLWTQDYRLEYLDTRNTMGLPPWVCLLGFGSLSLPPWVCLLGVASLGSWTLSARLEASISNCPSTCQYCQHEYLSGCQQAVGPPLKTVQKALLRLLRAHTTNLRPFWYSSLGSGPRYKSHTLDHCFPVFRFLPHFFVFSATADDNTYQYLAFQ